MKTVLVVGGAGYIGSHTCKALATAGFRPVVYDDLSTGHREFVRWGPFIEGDLLNRTALAEAFEQYEPVAAFHFAALADVGESMRDPAQYYRNNVVGALNLLDAARDKCVPIVFSSTCAVYGEAETMPITEDTPYAPVSPYGRTKLMIEEALEDYERAYGLRSIRLRYFNACGGDPEYMVGESHSPENHLIPRAILAALGRVPPLTIFGEDYPTPDGTAVRDYVHVCDLADAHVSAAKRLLEGSSGSAINLGSGSGFSVRQIIEAIEANTNLRVPHESGPRREGDPAILVADNGTARRVLGFTPGMSELPTIVRNAHGWLAGQGADIAPAVPLASVSQGGA